MPRFAPMPPGVDVAATASTPPCSLRSRPMWPMASIVGAPCWPLKNMISDAHDTRLPGTWPKISCVILCVRFSANEYGGLSESTGDWSLQVNDRSKTRADLSAPSKDSTDPLWALAVGGLGIAVPPAAASAAAHPAAPSHLRRVRSLMSVPPWPWRLRQPACRVKGAVALLLLHSNVAVRVVDSGARARLL